MCIYKGHMCTYIPNIKFLCLTMCQGEVCRDNNDGSLADNSNPLRPVQLIQTKEFYHTLVSQPKPQGLLSQPKPANQCKKSTLPNSAKTLQVYFMNFWNNFILIFFLLGQNRNQSPSVLCLVRSDLCPLPIHQKGLQAW